VRAVRVTREAGAMVALIELDGYPTFHHSTLPAPHRLIIDIKNVQQSVGPILKADDQVVIQVGEGGIERVRVGQMGSNVRVVFDTTTRPQYRIERSGARLLIRFSAQPSARSTTSQRVSPPSPPAQKTAPPQPSTAPMPPVAKAPALIPIQLSPNTHSVKPAEEPKTEANRVIARSENVASPASLPAPVKPPEPANILTPTKAETLSLASPSPSSKSPAQPVQAKPTTNEIKQKSEEKRAPAKSGKKNFREGMKYEESQQWDLAVPEFTLAVAAEPSSTEYRLHLLRAKQNASIMFLQRGDQLAEQGDYPEAYTAYQQAFTYDQTNELARTKMEHLATQQETQSHAPEAFNYNPRTGNITPANAEIKVASKPRPREVLQSISFREASLRLAIEQMADFLDLNVLFDESFKDDRNFRIKLRNLTMARALDMVLLQTKHTFEQIDRRTILIYGDNPVNRQRFEQMMVKTFYLGNADLEQARQLLQNITGIQRQVIAVKQLNALVVRDTPRNLKLMQEVLDSIDKNRAEVVIDVDIYEVSRSTSLELGNQLATGSQPVTQTVFDKDGRPVTVTVGNSSSLGNLGGIGRASIAAIAGAATSPFLGGVGTLVGLPPSSLSLLQSKGNSRLLASTQIHALDGEQNQTKVGRSVPVRAGTNYVPGYGAPAQGPGTNPPTAIANIGGAGSVGAFDSIQYKDVGLVIDATPTITTEGYVQIKMKLESTNVEPSGADINLTPSFTQRSLTTIARVLDGKTAVVAGIKQEAKGDSRASIPVLGMIPILGRFITTPKQTSSLSDIIITVTPHIIRSAALKQEDHLARLAGSQVSGITPTIEDLVQRAQAEDDQDRRLIARQMPAQTGTQRDSTDQAASATTSVLSPMPKAETTSTPTSTSPQPAPATGPTSPSAAVVPPTPPPAAAIAAGGAARHAPGPPELQPRPDAASAENSSKSATADLKLIPTTSQQQVGKSIFVMVAVDGQTAITGAKLSLKYNPALLQLKAVRDAGLLGNRAEITYHEQGGNLALTMRQAPGGSIPVAVNGPLLLIEFTALNAGQAIIDVNLNETALTPVNNLNLRIKPYSAAVQISR
jgi:general secretion pathway protein D